MTNTKEAAQSSPPTDMSGLETFAARLKFAMKSKGFKRAHIIYGTGATKSAVSKWLSGKTVPKNNIAFALAKSLDVSFEWLMSGTGSADDVLDTAMQETIKTLAEKQETFADRFVFMVRNKGVKPVDIMNATGASKSSVSKWSTGKSVPQKTLGVALAKYLGVSFEWLVLGTDGTKKNPVISIKPIDLNDSIANRIKTAMYNKDVVQADFHTRVGSTRSGVSKWLKGETKPNINSIQRIADVLDVSFQWLAYGGGLPAPTTPAPIAIPDKAPDSGVTNRIKALMYEQDMRAIDVAEGVGATRGVVSKWLSNDAMPSYHYIAKLAVLFNTSFKWIAYGHEQVYKQEQGRSHPHPPSPARTQNQTQTHMPDDAPLRDINYKPNLRLTADPVTSAEYEAPYHSILYYDNTVIVAAHKAGKVLPVTLKTSCTAKIQRTLAIRCNASMTDSFCYRNESDSMIPRITDNALCVADRSRTEIRDGKIYTFRHGVVFKTRFLHRRADGGILIRSANKDYPDEVVPVSELHMIDILGWVYCMSNSESW